MSAKEVIKRAIAYYGEDVQATVCMEECAELIQAISKMKRKTPNVENLIEEMADVCVCIDMLQHIYSITDEELHRNIDFKISRLQQRITEGED